MLTIDSFNEHCPAAASAILTVPPRSCRVWSKTIVLKVAIRWRAKSELTHAFLWPGPHEERTKRLCAFNVGGAQDESPKMPSICVFLRDAIECS